MTRILLTGQCTLHWGRMEFGNLGNYAIIEPLVRELHRVFPGAEIRTTFQMTDEFCRRERVTRLPMDLYYGWRGGDLARASWEALVSAAAGRRAPGFLRTGFMDEALRSDLVVDFSGDIWGDNADLVGKHRFATGLLKDFTAQRLGGKVAMIAGSPGPFSGFVRKKLAMRVFGKFDLVTNREEISAALLRKEGFPMGRVRSLACPAFLFRAAPDGEMREIYGKERLEGGEAPKVGFILCGWNMRKGPFGRWPREDSEYDVFAEAVEFLAAELGAEVILLSHNNGFVPPPGFRVTEGRDHQVSRQLLGVLSRRGKAPGCRMLTGIYDAAQTKAIIGRLDMLVSGRIHAAVSGFTQRVPTVVLDYGHEPKAHKLRGFAKLAGMSDYIADPCNPGDVIAKIRACWENREEVRRRLEKTIPEAQRKARESFDLLARLAGSGNAA